MPGLIIQDVVNKFLKYKWLSENRKTSQIILYYEISFKFYAILLINDEVVQDC